MAVMTLTLVAAGCGDDGGSAGRFGPGGLDGNAGNLQSDAEDILGDLADGTFDEGDLDDLMENAQDMAESLADSGSGNVTINGDSIDFTSELCFSQQGDFTIEGPGSAADGTPVWVSISQSIQSRAELAEFFEEEMITQLYGDADPIIESEVSLEYGKSDLFDSGEDGLPDFNASNNQFSGNEIEFNVNGNSASGGGQAVDFSGVAGAFGDLFDFTFSAGCS